MVEVACAWHTDRCTSDEYENTITRTNSMLRHKLSKYKMGFANQKHIPPENGSVAHRSLFLFVFVVSFFSSTFTTSALQKVEGSFQRASSSKLRNFVHLHELEGRPLRLRAGKAAKFERLNIEHHRTHLQSEYARIRKAGSSYTVDRHGHYVVRTHKNQRESVRQMLLLEVAEREALQYVPMDTFVVTVKTEAILRIAETAGVEGVYLLPEEMKLPPELLHRLDWRRSLAPAEGENRVWVVLDISLGRCLPSQADTEAAMRDWDSQLRGILKEGSMRAIRVGSRRKVSIEVLDSELHGALKWVVDQPETLWVDQRVPRVSTSKYANAVVIGKRLADWEPVESVSSPVGFTSAAVQNQVTSTPAGILHVAGNTPTTTASSNVTFDPFGGIRVDVNSSEANRTTSWLGNESVSSPVLLTSAAVQNLVTPTPADNFNETRNTSNTTSPVNSSSTAGPAPSSSTPGPTPSSRTPSTTPSSSTSSPAPSTSTPSPAPSRQMNGLWQRGLRGQGEIIGVGDTGLDIENCFFHDPEEKAPLCKESLEEGGKCVRVRGREDKNYKHRKVVGYRMIRDKNSLDKDNVNKNHGTMVAGVLAGRALSDDPKKQSFAEQYDGIAPDAKLAIDDMDLSNFLQGGLVSNYLEGVPTDLALNFWPWSYDLGARVHVNSWGDSSVFYTHASVELDEFLFNHPDMTIVMAAGNSGPNRITVLSPASAKNCIAVGATENKLESYSEYSKIYRDDTNYVKIDMEILLMKAPGSFFEGMGLLFIPSYFGPTLQLSEPVLGAIVLVDPPREAGLCNGFARGLGLKGKIGAIRLTRNLPCLQHEVAMEFERQGAIGVVLIFVSDTYLAIPEPGEEDLVGIPMAYLAQSYANTMLDILDQVGHNGSVVISFPTSWKKGERALTAVSSRGPTPDGRFKPDVVAPGENIITAAATSDREPICPTSVDKMTGLEVGSGTSFAAPFVAGAAALTRQYFREGWYNGTVVEPSAALVKAMILNCGVGVTYYQDYPFVWNQLQPKGREFSGAVPAIEQGYGRIQLDRVLRFADREEGAEDAFDLHVVDSQSLSDGEEYHLCVEMLEMPPGLERDRPFKVTLVWTDPPASPTSWGLLINDLDLRVTTPAANRMLLGNELRSYESVNLWHTVVDSVNNNEQVSIAAKDVEVGEYRVTVTPQEVPVGPQHFALVVTGQRMAIRKCVHMVDCPMNCSGVGTCVNGVCKCPFSRRGLGCELKNTELRIGETVQDSIVTGGWNYFYWSVQPDDVWWVRMSVTEAYSDPDMFIALNRMPTLSDFDGANLYPPGLEHKTQEFSSAIMKEHLSSHTGVWVLGINVYCCYTATVKVLLVDTMPEDQNPDPDIDGNKGTNRTPMPLGTPPSEGDAMDMVMFQMELPVTKEVFQMHREQYTEVVALVLRVYPFQVLDKILGDGEKRRKAKQSYSAKRVEDADEDVSGQQVRQRLGLMELRADGRDDLASLRVEFSIFVSEGDGYAVARRVSKDALETELKVHELPLPLLVSEAQVSAVPPKEPDEKPGKVGDKKVPDLADIGSHGMEDENDHVTPVIISLSCVMLLGLATFIFVWMRKKGAWSQQGSNASLVFIQSGSTPGAPSAPPFVDETAVLRGLCLNELGQLVNSPDETHYSEDRNETVAAARRAVSVSEEAGEGRQEADDGVELSTLPGPTAALLQDEDMVGELIDRRRVRREGPGAAAVIEMVDLGAARRGLNAVPANRGGVEDGEGEPEVIESLGGVRHRRTSFGGVGSGAAAASIREDEIKDPP